MLKEPFKLQIAYWKLEKRFTSINLSYFRKLLAEVSLEKGNMAK